jgi:hypothetical protein
MPNAAIMDTTCLLEERGVLIEVVGIIDGFLKTYLYGRLLDLDQRCVVFKVEGSPAFTAAGRHDTPVHSFFLSRPRPAFNPDGVLLTVMTYGVKIITIANESFGDQKPDGQLLESDALFP